MSIAKANKFEKIIILLEIIIFILLIVNIFCGCYSTYFSSEYMLDYSNSVLISEYHDSGNTYIYTENNDGDTVFAYEFGKLRCGAYDIRVEYFSDYYYNEDMEPESYDDLNRVVGRVDIYSNNAPSAVAASNILLKDGSNEIVSRFWIEPGYRLRDAKLDVTFWGKGRLGIKSIEIQEKRVYRVAYLIVYILIVLFADLMYLLYKNRIFCKNKWIIISLLLIFWLSCLPISINAGKVCDDLGYHLVRLASLSEGLTNSQFPNRIEQSVVNGYGYVGSLFYGEAFLYIPAVMILLGVKLQTAYCAYIVLVNLITILITYYCCSKMFQDKRIALLGTVLYTYAPYRYIDIFSRAAVGEYTAWAFEPLIIYGFFILYNKDKKEKIRIQECLPLIFGLSGIIQSHVLSCEMTAVFIGIFCLVYIKQTFSFNTLLALIKSVIITILLNAWFLYPFVFSTGMPLKVFSEEPELIGKRGLNLLNILSILPTQGNRFYLGVTFIIGIIVIVFCIANRQKWKLKQNGSFRIGLTCFAFTLISIFLTLKCFPYDRISSYSGFITKVICMIQFPWRFLMFASLFGTFTICSSLKMMPEKRELKKYYFITECSLAIILFILVSTSIPVNEKKEVLTKNDLSLESIGSGEYLLTGTDVDKTADKNIVGSEGLEYSKLQFNRGIYSIDIHNNSDSVGTVLLPIFDYDNYTAFDMDGNVIEHETGDNNRILLNIPSEFNGKIFLEYCIPVSWRVCEVISLVIIIGLLVLVIHGNGRLGLATEKRNEFIKKYLKYRLVGAMRQYEKCEDYFLRIDNNKLELNNMIYYAMMFMGIAFIVGLGVEFFVFKDILGLGKILFGIIEYSLLALLGWIGYCFCWCQELKKCTTKKEKREFVPSSWLTNAIRLILAPIIIFMVIARVLKMDDTAEYHMINMVNLLIALILAFVVAYKVILHIGELAPNIFAQNDDSLYILLLLIMVAFLFIFMYILNWIFFYYIFYNDYSDDLQRKDAQFHKIWNQEKQIFYLLSIVLMFVDYVKDSQNEIVHGLTVAFIVIFALDTLKSNWERI